VCLAALARAYSHIAVGHLLGWSPHLTMPFESGTVSVDIKADVDHRFVVEANNQQGNVIFRGEATVNLRAGEEADLPIPLVARTVSRLVATQRVTAVAGDTVLVTDPQSAVQGLRLVLPPQSLARDTTFTVTEVTNPQNLPVLQSQVGVIVDLLPSGTFFTTTCTGRYRSLPGTV
jgi:hypothetical protein